MNKNRDKQGKFNIKIYKVVVFTLFVSFFYPFLAFSSEKKTLCNYFVSDTSIVIQATDTTEFSTDTLIAPIFYTAKDSLIIHVQKKQIILEGRANVNTEESSTGKTDINGKTITYNYEKNIIKAWGGTDTSKNAINLPTITQGDMKSQMDTIIFNTKTQKGIFKNTYFNQGEIFINAEKVKKVDKDIAFASNGRFTTCNYDQPHFAFKTNKLKLVTNKIAVSGPCHPEFEEVPVPIFLPFGIFPMQRGRQSGLLPFQFAQNSTAGLGIEGIGYYKVINDYWDILFRANLYSYFGYSISVSPKYYKRYKYQGAFSIDYQRTIRLNESTLSPEEFVKGKGFQISWRHSMDNRARPGVSFSASVNAGSTKFNENVYDNPYKNFQNQMSSSIQFGKSWQEGKYNLSIQANHNQNNSTRLINVQLPTITFNTNTFYPFQKKEMVGKPKWYESLGLGYSGTFLGQVSFYDTAFSIRQLIDTFQWGAQHNVPISLQLPSIGPINLSPSISFSEQWMSRKIYRQWNDVYAKVDTTIYKGFYTARQMSFGLSASTRAFGMFKFKKGVVEAIRHEIKPSFGISYTPNMSNYHQDLKTVVNGTTYWRKVSQYEGNIYQGFGYQQFGGINFGIDNILEAKVRNKDTSNHENESKKIKILEGFSITSGYNFLADSLQLQPFNISARTSLFNSKLSVSSYATFDPYYTDPATGIRLNKFAFTELGSLGNFTNASLSLSTSFSSKKKEEKENKIKNNLPEDYVMTPDEQQQQLNYIRQNRAEFVDFDIPWNLSVSASLNYSRQLLSNYRGFKSVINSSVNLNGDFSLSPKWKAGGTLSLDVNAQKISMLTLFLTREMHCWQMSINVTPIGYVRSFSILLNPKSGILRDLRINRTRSFYTN